jgi:hypothetical protein
MRTLVVLVSGLAALSGAAEPGRAAALAAQGLPTGLRILIIEGEAAVNVVQQKTAVAPIIEVRDRNDQPVAGAVVRFAVSNGRATFSGARTLTATTNAVGRAVATGLTPTGSGALQISASAVFQGQTAVATIVQTNVMTAAEVAGAATASGAGSSATGAGGSAGGGRGVSGTTLGVVAGAATAGTVVAARELGAESSSTPHLYVGQFSGSESLSFSGDFCRTEQLTGTLRMDLRIENDTVTGSASINDGAITTTAASSGCSAFLNRPDGFGLQQAQVTGTPGSITFSQAQTNVVPPSPLDPQGTTNSHEYTFAGSLSGDTITGTIAHRRVIDGLVAGTTTFQVTLQ